MESVIRKLRIQTYKAQLAACDLECVALKKDLDRADLPEYQMLAMGHRLDEATKESLSLQFMLSHLEGAESKDKTVQ
jgi:hypothetical protein